MEIDDSSLQALDNSTDVLKVDNNPEVLSDTPGTFTDLQTVITGDTVELERNYTYDSDADRNIPKTGILIDSPIIIDGKGFTIDASHLSKIFNVTSSNVTFKNINFINANASAKVDKKDFSDCGAAIVAYSGMKGNENALNNISIIDCTFKDCYSAGHGAVYTFANNVTVTGSTFENNSAPQRGGAFYARGGKNIIVSQSKFNLNKQPLEGNNTLGGGAIYLYDCKATITDSSFDGNYAHNGGAIYVQANNTVIANCNFTNNEVTYDKANTGGGGAIYEQNQNNLTILNCRFEQNIAKHTGGAIYIHVSNNTIINGSTFFKNTVIDEGGAVYFYYCKNVTVGDCDFTANGGIRANDDSYGGAIRVHESDNTLIRDSNFTGNYVNHNAGGAIEYHSYNVTKGTILNCKFVNNTANSDGGAIYAHCKGEFNIIDCDFINNTVIDNQPVKSGGAVLINLKSEDENDTAFGNNALKTKILNSNFINNSAPLIGGGLVLRCNVRGYTFEDNIIENCTFIGNNATWGSAIFLYDGVKANLTNIVFGKNRANSTLLDITVDKEKSVYPSDINLTVTFTGKDNIANAIWNGGHHNRQPFKEQDPSHVYLKNITYEIYHDGELKTVTVYKDELQNPVKGYKNAKPGENIWQDTLENAQNITIEIYNNEESSLVANISAPLTEINGAMSNIQKGLKPGNYTAKAYHKTDAYYTKASDSVDFEIIPNVELDVNKTADVNVVGNNSLVNYTISVKNNGVCNATDVKIIDQLPENLTYTGKWGIIKSEYAIEEISDLAWNVNKITNGSEVSIWFTAVVNTNNAGNITNVVNVTCNENKTEITGNKTIKVVPVVLTVNKTVDVNVTGNNTEVTFTIVVNNTSEVKATEVKVIDVLPEGLVFVDATDDYDFSISDDERTLTWVISEMGNDSVELFVTVRTALTGNLTNNVSVTSKENNTNVTDNETVEVVPVILTVNKTANVTYVSNDTYVTFKIVVNNTSEVKSTNVVIIDNLPEGLEYVKSNTEIDDLEYSFKPSSDKKTFTWTIPEFEGSIELFITVKTTEYGDFTNNVTVTSNENNTPVKDNETVHVVPTNLTVVKIANVTTVSIGDLVEFTMNVTNTGLVKATNVNVTDILNSAFEVQSIGNETYLKYYDAQKIVWIIPSIDAGNSATVSVIVKLVKDGKYPNVVTVNCDENTTDVSNETNVISLPVVDLKINKTVDQTNVSVGDEVTYTITVTNLGPSVATNVNVTENMVGNVKITDVDTHNVGEYKDGIWYVGTLNKDDVVKLTITVKTLAVGIVENIVSVNSTEEDNDTSNNEYPCENVTVNPYPSIVNGTDVNVTYGDPIVVPYDSENATNVTYEIFDEDGNVVANGTVGPNGTVPVDQLPVGNYTVNWTTVVDGNHTPATNTSTITVNPAPSSVEGENVTVYYGDPIVIPYDSINATGVTYEIFDSEGNSIANGTVGPDGTVDVNQLPVGNYTVSWTTLVDGNHIPATNTSTITVLPIPTTITVGNVTAFPGENVTIPINVTTIDNVPFNGDVAVIMPDNSTQIVSVVNGTGIINWQVPEDYSPDKYPDSIRFPGSDIYEPSNGTGIIEVVKIPTQITVGNVTTYAGMEVTIPITVTAEDGNPFNGNVTITFPDGTTKTVEIINGEGTTTWFVPNDYTPETYPDTVKFSGDDKYLPSEGIGTITVIKTPVDIIVGNVTANPGDDVIIPIKVIPRDGSVYNGKITVELPDGTIKTVDIVNGKGNVPWKVPKDYKSGKYLVKAHSNETNVYYPADGTGIIKVIENQPVPPVDDGNKTHKDVPSKKNVASKKNIPQDSLKRYETGNPIMALLAVLALLGVGIRRRK